MRVIIVSSGNYNNPIDRVVKWALFHRIEYEVIIDMTTFVNEGYNLIVTDDLVPETRIFHYILQKKKVATPLQYIKNKFWNFSGCIFTNKTASSLVDLYDDEVEMKNDIATKIPTNHLALIAHGLAPRYDILWSIIISDWYSEFNKHVSDMYYHFWIESYHHNFIKTGDTKDISWIREQACFAGLPKRKNLSKTITFEKLKILIEKSEYTFDEIINGIEAYQIDVNVSSEMFMLHPFSIQGRYLVNPIKKIECNRNITLVGFYYDLGYENKPKIDYLKSIRYYAKLKYPIIFFGEEDTCKALMESRDDEMKVYTKTIVMKVEEWELISRFKEEFIHFDLDRNFRHRRRYGILTCNKVYAVIKAIDENPFLSKIFIWHDPGLYRHNLSRDIILEPLPYRNFPISPKGITVPSFCPSSGSTMDEYIDGHESMITSMIVGTIDGWREFFELYDIQVMNSFKKGNISTEQVVFTRIKGLYPEIITTKEFSYLSSSVTQYLELN